VTAPAPALSWGIQSGSNPGPSCLHLAHKGMMNWMNQLLSSSIHTDYEVGFIKATKH